MDSGKKVEEKKNEEVQELNDEPIKQKLPHEISLEKQRESKRRALLQVVLGKFMEVKKLREQLKREKEEFIKDRNKLTKDIE